MQNIKYITKFLPQRRMFCSESLLREFKSAVSNEKNQNINEFKELKDLMAVKAQEVLKNLSVCRVEDLVKEIQIKQRNLAEENESDCLDLEKLRTIEVRNERDLFANEVAKYIAFWNEKVIPHAEKLLRELPNRPVDIKQHSRIADLMSDPFIDHSVPGLSSFKLAVRWARSLKMSKTAKDRDKIVGHFYVHAIFPDENLKIPGISKTRNSIAYLLLLKELKQTCEEFSEDVLMYWPDLEDPTSFEKCISWITKEWDKHGFAYGIPPRMFIIYTLALRLAFSDDFGITEGHALTIGEAALQATEQMKKLVVFGEEIGAEIPPEIACGIDPVTKDAKAPKVIREIRPHFIRVVVNNRAKFRLVKPPKEFTGDCNHKSNIVILPSSVV